MSVINSLIEIQEFATLPPVAARILKMLEDDNSNVKDIAHIVETDVSLTLKLLRVANSPIYAVKTEITSIHQAIMILGLNRLTNIVLGVSIFSRFLLSSNKNAGEMMEKFWWHSSCTGIVAKAISNKTKLAFKETEFIGGLLHDIGKLAIIQFDSVKYREVVRLVNEENMLDIDAENKVFGTNHLEIGSQIANLWKLPRELSAVIANHSRLSEEEQHKDLTALVRLADILCELWDAGFNEGLRQIDFKNEESWLILCEAQPELQKFDFEAFTFELEEEFRKSAEFLNILMQN